MKIVLLGQCPAQKNEKRMAINRRTGRPFPLTSNKVKQWQLDVAKQLLAYKGQADGKVTITYQFYHKDNRRRDTDNCIASCNDALVKAVRASHAWAYCEHAALGSFDQRCTLCAYAEYWTAKAHALAEGKEFVENYEGAKRLVVWPDVRLEESSEAEAEILIAEALQHEQEALKPFRCSHD